MYIHVFLKLDFSPKIGISNFGGFLMIGINSKISRPFIKYF